MIATYRAYYPGTSGSTGVVYIVTSDATDSTATFSQAEYAERSGALIVEAVVSAPPPIDDFGILIREVTEARRRSVQWILKYWNLPLNLPVQQFEPIRSFYRKIIRCNRKGIGLRIRTL